MVLRMHPNKTPAHRCPPFMHPVPLNAPALMPITGIYHLQKLLINIPISPDILHIPYYRTDNCIPTAPLIFLSNCNPKAQGLAIG